MTSLNWDPLRQNSLLVFFFWMVVSVAAASPPSERGKTPRLPDRDCIPEKAGEAYDKDATSAGFRTFGTDETMLALSAFKKVASKHGTFRSSEEATRYFDRIVGASFKLLKQGRNLDKKGKPVGWRAEIVLRQEEPASSPVVVLTVGKDFWELASRNLSDISEFERKCGH